ncbi:MAG: hypothetical protein AAFU85_14155, partial [Planctomycetota bacterium]
WMSTRASVYSAHDVDGRLSKRPIDPIHLGMEGTVERQREKKARQSESFRDQNGVRSEGQRSKGPESKKLPK